VLQTASPLPGTCLRPLSCFLGRPRLEPNRTCRINPKPVIYEYTEFELLNIIRTLAPCLKLQEMLPIPQSCFLGCSNLEPNRTLGRQASRPLRLAVTRRSPRLLAHLDVRKEVTVNKIGSTRPTYLLTYISIYLYIYISVNIYIHTNRR